MSRAIKAYVEAITPKEPNLSEIFFNKVLGFIKLFS